MRGIDFERNLHLSLVKDEEVRPSAPRSSRGLFGEDGAKRHPLPVGVLNKWSLFFNRDDFVNDGSTVGNSITSGSSIIGLMDGCVGVFKIKAEISSKLECIIMGEDAEESAPFTEEEEDDDDDEGALFLFENRQKIHQFMKIENTTIKRRRNTPFNSESLFQKYTNRSIFNTSYKLLIYPLRAMPGSVTDSGRRLSKEQKEKFTSHVCTLAIEWRRAFSSDEVSKS